MRAFLGILAGIVVGFVALVVIALVGGLIFPAPVPAGGMSRPQQLIEMFETLPIGAKSAVILAWFGGALAGAAVAKMIVGRGWAAWTITGFFAVYVLLNVLILPMPGWLQAVAVAAPLIGGLIANHLVADRVVAAEVEADAAVEPAMGEPDDARL